ncbi:MAG: UDP-N-acetylenolpyruvoylglucosamine reductase [Thermodesulfovibrio sp.]|nr:UDP-N-acetylenolpyruvoylglucosamine reductase [Thermodesulfovibrio sp.]
MLINEKELKEALQGRYQGYIGFGISMKEHTTLGIGGRADVFMTPDDPLSLRNLISVLRKKGLPFMTLGRGSNLLVRDSGIDGAVLSLNTFNRIEVLKEGNSTAELFVEAGVPLQKLVNFCRDAGYAGIEGLTGIPGTVGGAICGNAGSYGCEIKDLLVSVAIMDAEGRLERYKAGGLGFSYRHSDIQKTDIVLSANLRLRRDDKGPVGERTDQYFNEKKMTQPIGERSAGCVFKNPEGKSAGRLIDEAGCKGMRLGDIEVSQVHANFFVNRGEGSAADYTALMEKIALVVHARFGVMLEPEIQVAGRV